MIRYLAHRKILLRTGVFSASIIGILLATQGCSALPAGPNHSTKTSTNTSAGTSTNSSILTGNVLESTRVQRNPVKRVGNVSFQTNVTGADLKNVGTIKLYGNGNIARRLGYAVFAVDLRNGVLEVQYTANTSAQSQLLQDSHSIALDVSFSIALNQPLVGVNMVDIAGFVKGKRVLDYDIPGNIMNEWGNDQVSSQFVKQHSQTIVG